MLGAIAALVGLLAICLAALSLVPPPKCPVTNDEPNRHTVVLPDERVLEYFKCPGQDAAPNTLVFIHGFSAEGFRLAHPEFYCPIYKQLGIKVLSISQPGFGLSDSKPGRRIEDFKDDVDAVLSAERVKEFYVAGVSAGCAHALSVMAGLGPQRALGALLLAPTMPMDMESKAGVPASLTVYFRRVLALPGIGHLLSWVLTYIGAEARMAIAPDYAEALEKMARDPALRPIRDLAITSFDRGSSYSWRSWHDNIVPLNNWSMDSFDLKSISQKVIIFSAPDDATNHPTMQLWLHKALPKSELVEVKPGFGHMFVSFPEHVEAGLRSLLVRAAAPEL